MTFEARKNSKKANFGPCAALVIGLLTLASSPATAEKVPLSESYLGTGSAFRLFSGDDKRGHVSEGWKLHVCATDKNALNVAQKVLPLLQTLNGGILHKVLQDTSSLTKMANTATQAGKFITIYPNSPAEAWAIIHAIKDAAAAHECHSIANEIMVSKNIFTRYGAYWSTKLPVPASDKSGKYYWIRDDRTRIAPMWAVSLDEADENHFPDISSSRYGNELSDQKVTHVLPDKFWRNSIMRKETFVTQLRELAADRRSQPLEGEPIATRGPWGFDVETFFSVEWLSSINKTYAGCKRFETCQACVTGKGRGKIRGKNQPYSCVWHAVENRCNMQTDKRSASRNWIQPMGVCPSASAK